MTLMHLTPTLTLVYLDLVSIPPMFSLASQHVICANRTLLWIIITIVTPHTHQGGL